MHLLSVNAGAPRAQSKGREDEITGIYKTAVTSTVEVTRLGIAGDFIGDAKNHGGPDQAVFVYGEPDYAWWENALRRVLEPGTFGENLTISELESADLCIGDRLHVGSAILEVTAPRTPCMTLARRMGDGMFVKAYRRAERPGLYCRVIRVGRVTAGDAVQHEPIRGEGVKAIDIFREHYALETDETGLRRYLAAPLAIRARADIEKRLRRMLAPS